MVLKVFGSNSNGNGYALTTENGYTLLIECGVRVIEIKKYLDFNLSKVVGCLLSHSHGDHSKYIKEYINSGINVYTSFETIQDLKLQDHHRLKVLLPKIRYDEIFKNFAVMPFTLKHDVYCFGFLINNKEMGNLAFITDSYYIPWRFANIKHWMIECNYSSEIIDDKTENKFVRNRVLQSHLSLENCIDVFKANDMRNTVNIVLLHLSDTNSDEKIFKEKVETETLKNVHIASKGIQISLNKNPF